MELFFRNAMLLVPVQVSPCVQFLLSVRQYSTDGLAQCCRIGDGRDRGRLVSRLFDFQAVLGVPRHWFVLREELSVQ